MLFLFLCMLTVGLVTSFVQKYILRIKEPNIEELWKELHEQDWFKDLLEKQEVKMILDASKETGLLRDPYYVRKIIDQEGYRDGFIEYIYDNSYK
ncbi:hypothetical protein IMZ08_10815 [Bacillus luteolus]|uniref:Uncharacterized protein n=1 Tax=Litchfieldia luteola TaxID=682179 RepID=A0ABR9QJ71_9BACI|nr:hypothetical protein [Cytobacillus luteolus]MBE4908548.1 hypothetical protein [Cytobacillus luteolus]MBP1941401.1 hypothetical protein [Cytobacillus luteolus]